MYFWLQGDSEQQMFIKFCFKLDKTAMEVSDMTELAFVDEIMSRTQTCK